MTEKVFVEPDRLSPPPSLFSVASSLWVKFFAYFNFRDSSMASTSYSTPGTSVFASDAVQVLVSSLADESSLVRESAMASLKDIVPVNPLLVLDCCFSVSRGGRRRFGNMAGAFQVMALGVQALDNRDVDSPFLIKLAKIATRELISSKEFMTEWQRAASCLLVAIGCHTPDLMMEELFIHLSGSSSALPSIIQILADFASVNAFLFTPRLKGVLSKVLPIMGNVRDPQRPIFANALKCWCQAVWQCNLDSSIHSTLDADVMSFLNSAFDLLLRSWASSRNLKVRSTAVEALGQLVGLITRAQLKIALPRLVPSILDLYKKDQHTALIATCALHNLLNSSLLSDSGPPLLDFEELTIILSTLLPVLSTTSDGSDQSDFAVGLKTYNEVQRCFLTVGQLYPDDLFTFLLNKCRLKEESTTYGAVCILKHLLPRSTEAWHSKRIILVTAVKSMLDEQNLGVKKALSELILVMASHCYLTGQSGEAFVEYLVSHCALSNPGGNSIDHTKARHGTSSAMELRAVCEKGLLLLTITTPETEHILWPFLLKMIVLQAYTSAVAIVCRCISELFRNKFASNNMLAEYSNRNDVPTPEEIFARLLVLLHDPLARDQLPIQILTVLCHLSPLFPKNIYLFWQEEVPKMKAYISDTEDLTLDTSYQEAWDEMIINFLAESLDVIQNSDWVMLLGNAFANQYDLYSAEDEHLSLLHRCLGMLLQKVGDRSYVREKIDWMHKHATISIPSNRLGLAKGIGLVAASHLDTVLEKLKTILDNIGHSVLQRLLLFFSESYKMEESDDIHAALALMYGYAARYAPSSVIEARIDALVGTNMLSRLLHVRHPTAKQAVINAIDLLGRAVINAANNGASFPLKKRDQLLDYILTLMGRDDKDDIADCSQESLRTKALALSACTTLVSVDPKLSLETRNLVMKATMGFFALPNEPSEVIKLLINNLITLLCAILLSSGEDGRSRAEQLLHILRQLDPYVSSSDGTQRKRGCCAVYEVLLKFRALCMSGFCSRGCHGNCIHIKQGDGTQHGNLASLPLAFVLPSRESLCLGERVIIYIPRCADTCSEVMKVSAQILCLLFNIALSLPKPVASVGVDIQLSYDALTSLEDVIAILKREASIDSSEILYRVIFSLCTLLTKEELVAALQNCLVAVCDKVRPSAEGAIQAITELVTRRGNELSELEISRTTQSLLSAASHVTEKHMRLETFGAICSVAESTRAKTVFDEVLLAAGKDLVTKDISRLRGGWSMQDAFYTFSQHPVLSIHFLEHLVCLLNGTPPMDSGVEGEKSISAIENQENHILLASVFGLTAFFRGGGKVGKRSVEQSYANVLASLILQFGSCHGLANSGQPELLRVLLTAFLAFCDCVGDLEMGKIVARHGELNEMEKWINVIGELASSLFIKRPKEIQTISLILAKSFNHHQRFQRESAAAALSEFVRYSGGFGSVLEQMVEVLCRHVSDESPTVRCLCLKGLVQMPAFHLSMHATQILGVIMALLDDGDESVQLTALSCLLMIVESTLNEAVEPVLLNLCLRLRNIQMSMNPKMRADAFVAFGLLSSYAAGPLHEAFVEQIHSIISRLVLHLHDDDQSVRQACRNSLKRLFPLIEMEGVATLCNSHSISSDYRRDYEDFLRDLAKNLSNYNPSRFDTCMTSTIQAFDAPWPIIQANAVYFASCLLSLSDDQRILALHYTQVFGMIVGKITRSTDAVVRASCSSALGLLLKSTKSSASWKIRIDRAEKQNDQDPAAR